MSESVRTVNCRLLAKSVRWATPKALTLGRLRKVRLAA
jgi:hypothetical protein